MSRRRPPDGKLLLDTSFLLPVLGFETSERVHRAFEKLGRYELYYAEISIVEALWKISKVIRGTGEEISRIRQGLKAIVETMHHVKLDENAVVNALNMYRQGHRDMVDNLLYSTALANNLKLLTIDKELIEFVRKENLPPHAITTPEHL